MFTSLDTFAGSAQDPLSMNRFLYAEANPATLVDPSGHMIDKDDQLPATGSTTPTTFHYDSRSAPRSADDVREAASHSVANRAYAAEVTRTTLATTYARAVDVSNRCYAAGPQAWGYCSSAARGVMTSGPDTGANALDPMLSSFEHGLTGIGDRLSAQGNAMIAIGGRVDPLVADGQGALITGGTKLGESGEILGKFGKSVFFLGSALQMKDALDREFAEGDAHGRSWGEQLGRGLVRGSADIAGSYFGAIGGGFLGGAAGGAATGGLGGEFVGGFVGAFFGSIAGSEAADHFFTSWFGE
jgi:hypothetical protein